MKKSDLIRGRAGFTLIEILLSVTIIAFMAGSLYAAFAAGLKLEKRAKQSFLDLDENRMIMEQIYKDLGRAAYYDFRGSFPERKSFFTDGAQLIFLIEENGELKWVRYMLTAPDQGQVKETRLGMVTSHNVAVTNGSSIQARTLALVRDENDFVHFFALADTPQHREILSSRIPDQGWEISFASSTETQPQIEWKPSWTENFLPAAVRVNVSMQPENGPAKKFSRDFVLPAGGHDEP